MITAAATPNPIHVGNWLLFLRTLFGNEFDREFDFAVDDGAIGGSPRSNVNSGSGSEGRGSMENGSGSGCGAADFGAAGLLGVCLGAA